MGKAGLTALKHGVRLVLEADLILLSVWDHVSNYPKSARCLDAGGTWCRCPLGSDDAGR